MDGYRPGAIAPNKGILCFASMKAPTIRANPMPKSLGMRNWRSRAILRGSVKKTGHRNGRDYESLLRRVLASGDPYQVEILRRKGRYQVRITVEEAPAPVQTSVRHGWVGVDTNSTFLALCHVRPDGNPQAFATIGDPRLFDVRS
jgi:hypothetical protein